MKLVIDLADVETWDEETVASVIKRTVDGEIERFIKGLIKDALKQQETAMRALVKRAAEKDWKRVAKALEQLQEIA